MSNENTEKKRPTHDIMQVIGEKDKARWNKIGAAWPNKDGKGFNLVLDAFPAHGRLVLREVKEETREADGGQS